MRRKILAVFVLLLMTCATKGVHAESSYGDEKVFAIQNRVFHRNHELGVLAGYIADDDFYHVYPAGFNYIFHFNENWSWEVARAQWLFTQEKSLKEDLETNFGVTPEEFEEPKYMLHSHLMWKPFYGKDAVLNKGIINRETYLFLGGGLVHYEWEKTYGEGGEENAPSLSFGIGTKYFLTKNWCINFEIRDMLNFREDDTINNLSFGLGLGFRFNLGSRKSENDDTIEKLNKYLNENDENLN